VKVAKAQRAAPSETTAQDQEDSPAEGESLDAPKKRRRRRKKPGAAHEAEAGTPPAALD
jgi:hypothetical protein